ARGARRGAHPPPGPRPTRGHPAAPTPPPVPAAKPPEPPKPAAPAPTTPPAAAPTTAPAAEATRPAGAAAAKPAAQAAPSKGAPVTLTIFTSHTEGSTGQEYKLMTGEYTRMKPNVTFGPIAFGTRGDPIEALLARLPGGHP